MAGEEESLDELLFCFMLGLSDRSFSLHQLLETNL